MEALIGYGILMLFSLSFISSMLSQDWDKDFFYNQTWYNDAGEKEFGDDYYYPPATHRTFMNYQGVYTRVSQHYKPVRNSTYSPTETKLTPWFKEVKLVYNGGCEKFVRRDFC